MATIFTAVKRFVVDMKVLSVFQIDNDAECSNTMFVDFYNGLGIRREFMAAYTPQQNDLVKGAIS